MPQATYRRAQGVLRQSRTQRVLTRIGLFVLVLACAYTYSELTEGARDSARDVDTTFRRLSKTSLPGVNSTSNCDKCLNGNHTYAQCSSIGVCTCEYPSQCTQCLDSPTFTIAQCESYGIDCTEDCPEAGAGGHGDCKTLLARSLDKDYPALAITIYILGMSFVFLGIAIICDDHFCVALEVICDVLELDEAVAGATFMAAGGSAPELATSLITTFGSRDSTGLGTILGSAVFNLVVIIALSGMKGEGPDKKLQPMPFMRELNADRTKRGLGELPTGLFLDWRPLTRDAVFYVLSIILCIWFSLTPVGDGWCVKGQSKVETGSYCKFNNVPGFTMSEGIILVAFYALYIGSMVVNDSIMNFMEKMGMPDHIAKYVAACGGEEPFLVDDVEASKGEKAGEEDHMIEGSEKRGPVVIAVGESRQPVSDVAGEIGPAPTMPAPKLTVGAVSLTDVTVTGGSEDMRELKRQIAKLQMEHRAMALALKHVKEEIAPLTSQTLYEYKLHEGEEEEGIIDRIVGLCAFPWNVAFTCTIPKCDRESFQVWDEEKPTYFGKFDVDMQNVLTDYCRRTDRLTEDENLSLQDKFFPGKRTQKEVTLSYERSKKYLIAFFMSIVWIIIASYFMVECAHGFGCHVGIPPFVMGVAVLAAGTSIPDALASMVVAEQGDGDMAVANAIGSNVFDICIGMGLPLIISQMVYAEPYPVTDTIPALATGAMLIVITIVLVLVLMVNKWILTKKTATCLLFLYALYVGAAILFQYNTVPVYTAICTKEVLSATNPGTWQSCHNLEHQ